VGEQAHALLLDYSVPGMDVYEKLFTCMEYAKTTFKLSHVIILCIVIFIMGFLLGYVIKRTLTK